MNRTAFSALLIFCCLGLFATRALACDGSVGNQVGQCAPSLVLESTDGLVFDLQKNKGKVVVINFWATWCEPCVEELPSLEKLYKTQIKNLEFVSVSIDNNQKAIDRFFTNNPGAKVTFPILKDFDKKVSRTWKTFKVPETYIIDTKGVIRDKVLGIRDWEDQITKHYLELLAKQ